MRKKKEYDKQAIYFTKETEQAIIAYNNSTDDVERNQIYNDKIKSAFISLVDGITTKIVLYNPYEAQYIKTTTLTHITSALGSYKPDKGKAYSYFTMIARNYMISLNSKYYDYCQKHPTIDTGLDEVLNTKDSTYDEQKSEYLDFAPFASTFIRNNINQFFKATDNPNIRSRKKRIALSIAEILQNTQSIQLDTSTGSKKHIYAAIRALSASSTEDIAKVMKALKPYMERLRLEYRTQN